MESLLKYRFSLIAGIFAAGGSFFGKLPSYIKEKQLWNVETWSILQNQSFDKMIGYTFVHAIPFLIMIICNVLNLRYFLKALQSSDQSITATVLTVATNYMASFVLALLIYKEHFSFLSVVGSILIVAGLWFLVGNDKPNHHSKIN